MVSSAARDRSASARGRDAASSESGVHVIRPITPRWLDRAACAGDPTVDAIVRSLGHRQLAALDGPLARLCRDPDISQHEVPSALASLFPLTLPAWAERSRLRSAARFAERHRLAIAAALHCAALDCAASGASAGARELERFGRDVLAPGAFDTGRAARSIACLRLLHSVGRLDGPEQAFSQERLLTLVADGSVGLLEALRTVGVAFERRDAEDLVHLFRVAGSMLGVHEPWLPRDLASARRLASHLRLRRTMREIEGRAEVARSVTDCAATWPEVTSYFASVVVAGAERSTHDGAWASSVLEHVPRVTTYLSRLGHPSTEDDLRRRARLLLEECLPREHVERARTFYRPLSLATLHRGAPPHVLASRA